MKLLKYLRSVARKSCSNLIFFVGVKTFGVIPIFIKFSIFILADIRNSFAFTNHDYARFLNYPIDGAKHNFYCINKQQTE